MYVPISKMLISNCSCVERSIEKTFDIMWALQLLAFSQIKIQKKNKKIAP